MTRPHTFLTFVLTARIRPLPRNDRPRLRERNRERRLPASWLSKSAEDVSRRALGAFAKRYNAAHAAAAPLAAEDLVLCATNELDELDDCDLRAAPPDALVLVLGKPQFAEVASS